MNTEKLNLIEGVFSEYEAKEILESLFDAKMNFLNIQNWSSYERFGKDDERVKEKIPLLKKEIQKLHAILNEARKHKKKLVVTSEITIALSDD